MNTALTLSATDLMSRLPGPNAPRLLDVSLDDDVAADPHLIPTAMRALYRDPISAVGPDTREVVTICQKGGKISHGAAALLRASGITARALEGGNVGWRDAGLPRIPIRALPPVAAPLIAASDGCLVHNLCAWLWSRWAMPASTILSVPAAMMNDVADRFDGMVISATSPMDTAQSLGLAEWLAPTLTYAAANEDVLARLIDGADTEPSSAAFTLFDALHRSTGHGQEHAA